MKSFLRMKYEQFLMRLFDRILKAMRKTNVDWYPKHVLCKDLEEKIRKKDLEICDLWDQIHDRDVENDHLNYQLLFLDDRVEGLEKKLDKYENEES